MLLVVGSVALDSVETPFGRADNVLGGSGTFFSAAASLLTPVQLVGVVGSDYPVDQLEPHRVANYLLETARKIHLWYHKAHVLNEPAEIMNARLLLARASMIVMRNGLSILGITAPERM